MSPRRRAPLRARLADEELGAFIVTDAVNIAYLTAFDGVFDGEDAHALVVTADATRLYTDSRYIEALTRASAGTDIEVVRVTENLYVTLCQQLMAAGIGAVALEASAPYGRFRFISEKFTGRVEVVDGWVEEIRQVKEPVELERIERAAELTDRAFSYIIDRIAPGVSEWSLALEIEMFMRKEGSDGVAFPPIVASGPNSALPHARVSHRVLEAGDFVKLDFGARLDGYCADMTRTVVLGRASERQREIHAAVLEANLAGIAAVRPGRQGSAIDAEARAVLERHGYGELFGHGLGHGVGMEVHELPSVGPRATRSVLEGSVVTVEPGVYVPGFGGVRIEDLVAVEDGGARVLSRSEKGLIEIG